MQKPCETIYVQDKTFSCEGSSDHLGHPRIYLTFTEADEIDCPYCGRHFIFSNEKRKKTPLSDGVALINESS